MKKLADYEEVRCRTCGYTTKRFNGWAFCGPCRTPGQPSLYHDFEAVKLDKSRAESNAAGTIKGR